MTLQVLLGGAELAEHQRRLHDPHDIEADPCCEECCACHDDLDVHFLVCGLCASGDDACEIGERLMDHEMSLDDEA